MSDMKYPPVSHINPTWVDLSAQIFIVGYPPVELSLKFHRRIFSQILDYDFFRGISSRIFVNFVGFSSRIYPTNHRRINIFCGISDFWKKSKLDKSSLIRSDLGVICYHTRLSIQIVLWHN